MEDRPIVANYATGCLVAMSVHMFISSLSALIFPEMYESPMMTGTVYLVLLLIVAVWEGVLAVGVYLGSGLAYKLAFITVLIMLINVVVGIWDDRTFGYDFWIQGILSATCIILMLTPQMRKAYKGWSLPSRPAYSIE